MNEIEKQSAENAGGEMWDNLSDSLREALRSMSCNDDVLGWAFGKLYLAGASEPFAKLYAQGFLIRLRKELP